MKINKSIYSILIILLISLILTACQSTPTESVIQEKDGGALMNIINEEAGDDSIEFPEHYDNTIKSENINYKIIVDADIQVPDTTRFPVVEVMPHVFSQQEADYILNTLINNNELIVLPEFQVKTKEDILDEIYSYQVMLKDNTDEQQIKSIKNAISSLQEELETAPETYIESTVSKIFHKPELSEANTAVVTLSEEELESLPEEQRLLIEEEIAAQEEWTNDLQYARCIEGSCSLGKDTDAEIRIYNYKDPKYNFISFINMNSYETIINNPFIMKSLDDDQSLSCMSIDEAKEYAADIIKEMGISEMEITEITSIPKGDPQTPQDQWPYCYQCIFTRMINNVSTTYATSVENYGEAYAEVWKDEYLQLCIDETGVVAFYWCSPSEITETLSTNVSLLPFNEIIKIFENQIFINGQWDNDSEILEKETHVTKITLGMMKIKRPDTTDEYIIIPVWDFFGYDVNTYSNNTQYKLDENNQLTLQKFGHSYLTINAIDGSIIDRSLGY